MSREQQGAHFGAKSAGVNNAISLQDASLHDLHARMLAESLPFVQAMHGQTVVIAFVGRVLFDAATRQRLMQDVALLALLGMRPVLVQGGTPDFHGAEAALAKGLPELAAMQVTRAAMAEINLEMVRQLNQEGVKAVGLSGQDARCLIATVGAQDVLAIADMDTTLIALLQANQMLPVVMTLAPDTHGVDRLIAPELIAAQLAQRLGAHSLLMVSEGDVLHRAGVPDGLVGRVELENWLDTHANENVALEIRAALAAVYAGVPTVHLVDASEPDALVAELLTNEGKGTVLCRRAGQQLVADTARYFNDADSVIRNDFTIERKRVVRF